MFYRGSSWHIVLRKSSKSGSKPHPFTTSHTKMVGMREKLNRFIEALARCEGVMEFTEQDWGDLVECIVVKPDTLTFEFKDNSKIEVAIQP